MKSLFNKLFYAGSIVVVLLYLLSCCSAYITPSQFSFISIFALGFPYLFIIIIICFIISLFISRRFAIFLFLVLLCGYKNFSNSFALNLNAKWHNQKQNTALRIITWNVEDFVDTKKDAIAYKQMLQLIAFYNPDILCVQEFSNVQNGEKRVEIKLLLDSMGFKYSFQSKDEEYKPWKFSHVTRGSAIFSKYILSDTSRITITNEDKRNENLISAAITFNNKPLKIFTAHLASFRLYTDTTKMQQNDIYKITYSRKRAIQYKLREVEQVHQQQVHLIRNLLAQSNVPAVYCGDMNTTPCSYTYRYLKGDMQDAFKTKGFGIGATFYKVLPTLRIDYCFANNAFTINQCTVAQKKLSDHYPVITDISWK